ncbi:hypothetical protein SESBI_38171 [Sesbania bispinosa]|nr:hypothetical protein SESBI_38171 [Sesbania bispinosa]
MALYLSNIFGCFSDSESSPPQSKRYICDDNVCILRSTKENLGNGRKKASTKNIKPKPKQSLRTSFARLSAKRSAVS